MIAGIILAAGEARRMGQLKQLLPLGGKPMIWHVANAACGSRLDPVLLVTGAGSDAVVSSLQEFPITSIHNENWADGQAGSLRTGIRDLPEETEAVLFLPADQPLISAKLINALIDAYYRSGQSIICPFYGVQRGAPVLFGWKEWKNALSTLTGDQGARQLIIAHPEAVHRMEVDSGELFWDVDTPEDYQRMCDRFLLRHPEVKIIDQ